MKKPPATCPQCGAAQVVPILFGMPTTEAEALAQQDKLILGGCGITPDDPDWQCLACDAQGKNGVGKVRAKGGKQ